MSAYDPIANSAHTQPLQNLLKYVSDNRYVCPMPTDWNKLYKMLPKTEDARLPLPLILAAWNTSGELDKWLRFEEHLVWADAHGVLEKVDRYLRRLSPKQWLRWDAQ